MDAPAVTPTELARDLDVSARTIRAFLRAEFGAGHAKYQWWLLDEPQIIAVRRRFGR